MKKGDFEEKNDIERENAKTLTRCIIALIISLLSLAINVAILLISI